MQLFLLMIVFFFFFDDATGNPMQRYLLDDAYSKSINARCLDGSSPAYYLRKASRKENFTKFVVYFQGGGWCYSLTECLTRSSTPIGSSSTYPETLSSKGGIVDPDPLLNPNFHSWNHVWVPYCDGTSWSGNRIDPVTVGNGTIYYRGRANMQAIVAALRRDAGMEAASDVIMDGGSAGGLTVLLHADFFGSLLPAASNFAAIGDAGWFRPSTALDKIGYTKLIGTMVANSNATSDMDCVRSQVKLSNCFFAPIVFPYLSTKMFVLEGAYDSWQLHHILGFPCATYGESLTHCSKAQNASLENYGAAMRDSIGVALDSTEHHKKTAGTFVSQCIIHVQSVINENHDVWHGMLRINGGTPHDVVSEWYFGGGKGKSIENCGRFGCNRYCQTYT